MTTHNRGHNNKIRELPLKAERSPTASEEGQGLWAAEDGREGTCWALSGFGEIVSDNGHRLTNVRRHKEPGNETVVGVFSIR